MSHKKRKKNRKEIWEDPYPDTDGNFAYIAGYTPGGAPYGVTWEEMGIDPDLPFEEKVKLLEKKEKNPDSDQKPDILTDDLPF